MVDHTVRAYDKELDALARRIVEMGGIAEKMVVDAMDALANAGATLAHQVVTTDPRSTHCSAKSRWKQSSPSPEDTPWRTICAKSSVRSASPATSSGWATSPKTSPSVRSKSVC